MAAMFGPGTRDNQWYNSIQEQNPYFLNSSKGKNLLKYKLKASCISCIKTCSILATKVVFERKVYYTELYGYIHCTYTHR